MNYLFIKMSYFWLGTVIAFDKLIIEAGIPIFSSVITFTLNLCIGIFFVVLFEFIELALPYEESARLNDKIWGTKLFNPKFVLKNRHFPRLRAVLLGSSFVFFGDAIIYLAKYSFSFSKFLIALFPLAAASTTSYLEGKKSSFTKKN